MTVELSHLEVDRNEAFRSSDKVGWLGIDDDDAVAGTIPPKVRRWDRAEAFFDEHVVNGLIGSDAIFLIPELGNHDGWLTGWLANNHAGFVRDRHPFKPNVASKHLNVESHSIEIL